MVYSLEERKVGSYFGEDLYEKCVTIPDFDNSWATVELEGVDKIVNAYGRLIDTAGATRFFGLTDLDTSFNASSAIMVYGYDYDYDGEGAIAEVDLNAKIGTNSQIPTTNIDGFIKVQYTKRATE